MEHTFLGTWEIVRCTYEEKTEISGLEGIKFRLDDTSDITWYNDLVSPLPESKDCGTCCDSASVLFSCETFDVNENNPRLIFGAFAGHSIEFRTNTLTPTDNLFLDCENWYVLECKRLKESQAAEQEKEFSFANALKESYFSDVIIKSSNGFDYPVHSCILRLSGFDCSMCVLSSGLIAIQHQQHCKSHETSQQLQQTQKSGSNLGSPKASNLVKISVTHPSSVAEGNVGENQEKIPSFNLSPIYLQPPTEYYGIYAPTVGIGANLSTHRTQFLSNSFDCLSTNAFNGNGDATLLTVENGSTIRGIGSLGTAGMRRFPPTSHSDSHLETHPHCKNIFNFCQDLMMQTIETTGVCNTRRPPLSPFRARSPSPFPSSLDTPPSSPLTPVSVLYNLPSFLLTPILHWLYTESLMPDMDEDICRKLINFAETQPSLSKLVEPTNKYLKLIRLKKFVANIMIDLHSILNRIIQVINPVIISSTPAVIFSTFKDCLRECAVGCAKVLQFCNIFIKDIADITRYQRNEIIKYVRTRFPIFMSQIQQLLRNILSVFMSLTVDDKSDLVNYLVPEIEQALLILKNVIEEVKNSLEKMCKDLKSSHLKKTDTENIVSAQIHSTTLKNINTTNDDSNVSLFGQSASSPRRRRNPPVGLTLYDNPTENQRFFTAENDLKFVLYMYEVRKMRDIYGRISTALDIIQDKKTIFCEMDFLSKCSTIHQNLEQLIVDIPGYISIIKNLSDRLDEKLGWKEFKFCFKLATSQINGVIVKLLDHREALRNPINAICNLVQKKDFTLSLLELRLLESSNVLRNELPDQENNIGSGEDDGFSIERKHAYDYRNVKLNLVRHLCDPPIAAQSILSKNSLRLLHSGQLTDMEFEVHTFAPHNANVSDSHRTSLLSNKDDAQSVLQVHTFRAHRVIVSARCEWFKKALLSGMQESITRKIIITDTTPVIFRRLLLYLYGAPIDKTVGAEQICELMLLADQYSIDDLKELCENTLNSLIDEDSVLCLLGIADRYMAAALKSNCLSFLSQHSNLTKSEMFRELPQILQVEVMDLVQWYGRVSEPWNDGFNARSSSRNSLKSPSKTRPKSRKSSPSYI